MGSFGTMPPSPHTCAIPHAQRHRAPAVIWASGSTDSRCPRRIENQAILQEVQERSATDRQRQDTTYLESGGQPAGRFGKV
jgi:hypothetical protein